MTLPFLGDGVMIMFLSWAGSCVKGKVLGRAKRIHGTGGYCVSTLLEFLFAYTSFARGRGVVSLYPYLLH